MIMNKAVLIAIVAALSEQAQAFNVHRNAHQHLHDVVAKRAVKTDIVVVWETVYVSGGHEITSSAFQESKPAPPQTTMVTAVKKMEAEAAAATNAVVGMNGNVPVVGGPVASTDSQVVAEHDGEVVVGGPVGDPEPAPTVVQATSTTQVAPPPAPTTTTVTLSKVSRPAPTKTSEKAPPPPAGTTSSKAAPSVATEPSGSSDSLASSSSGKLFSSKRGIAYNDPLLANLLGSSCKSCGWGYNWGSTSQGLKSGLSYVPMLWSDAPTSTNGWTDAAKEALGNGAKALMSFNEPDMNSQANMSPAQAAASHVKYMNPYAGKAKIGAPAVTNSGSPGQGLSWLQSFVDACKSEGCHYDFCAVHWYSGVQYKDTLFDLLEKANKVCGGKPVWLTEFAPSGSDEEIGEFMKDVLPKLDALDYVEAYSYFMTSIGSLFSSSSLLSSFGQLYADLF